MDGLKMSFVVKKHLQFELFFSNITKNMVFQALPNGTHGHHESTTWAKRAMWNFFHPARYYVAIDMVTGKVMWFA